MLCVCFFSLSDCTHRTLLKFHPSICELLHNFTVIKCVGCLLARAVVTLQQLNRAWKVRCNPHSVLRADFIAV